MISGVLTIWNSSSPATVNLKLKYALHYGRFFTFRSKGSSTSVFGSVVNEVHRLISLAAPGGGICSEEYLEQARVSDTGSSTYHDAGTEYQLPQAGRAPLKFFILDTATGGLPPRVALMHATREKLAQQLSRLIATFADWLTKNGAEPDKLVGSEIRLSILEPARIKGKMLLVPSGFRQRVGSLLRPGVRAVES